MMQVSVTSALAFLLALVVRSLEHSVDQHFEGAV
jgi:hypothetical protein